MNSLFTNQTVSAQSKMLDELYTLEHFSDEYKKELLYISKRIRRDIWSSKNTALLAHVLSSINSVYKALSDILGNDVFFSLSTLAEYVRLLGQYSYIYSSSQPVEYFNKFLDDLQLYSNSLIIEDQWKNIIQAEDGLKSFIDIFDDVFSQCIDLHKDKFFHPLSRTDILCRAVKGTGYKKERFIPWQSKTNNRWNSPGTQFLYLSFSKQPQQYSSDLSLNEFVCLQELRATKGEIYSFCDFLANTPGSILDLSYNDMSMADTRRIIDRHYDDTLKAVMDDLLKDPSAIGHAKLPNKKKISRDIKSKIEKHSMRREIIEEAYAKQYLIMICSCIYKKVDEIDEAKKELAYKSFHILCDYLKSKKVTGIIYPCTRTKEVVGKNLVLFNVNDADPIESTIRERLYM